MAVSGRFVLLVALGVVPIVYFNDPAVIGWWLLILLVAGIIDLVICLLYTSPSPRD